MVVAEPFDRLGFVSIDGKWLPACAHHPRYSAPVSAAEVLAKLVASMSSEHHEFWPDDASITSPGVFNWSQWRGHQQVTDMYLLALAVKHGGRLVTFDQAIPREMVVGANAEQLVSLLA